MTETKPVLIPLQGRYDLKNQQCVMPNNNERELSVWDTEASADLPMCVDSPFGRLLGAEKSFMQVNEDAETVIKEKGKIFLEERIEQIQQELHSLPQTSSKERENLEAKLRVMQKSLDTSI